MLQEEQGLETEVGIEEDCARRLGTGASMLGRTSSEKPSLLP